MSTVAEHLPLPVGTRFAAPVRRSRIDVWAAPDPTQLVLDPWAAPVGLPVARTLMSPWSPPTASTRITWMPAPAVLFPPPNAAGLVREPDAEVATERALATLRAFAEGPHRSARPTADSVETRTPFDAAPASIAVVRSDSPPMADPLRIVTTAAQPVFAPPQPGTAVDNGPSPVRWRVIAVVSGIGVAVAAAVTLLASVL
jgi:hypothetical protein